MNIAPKSISKIVISHIHGDHVGGLEGFLEKNSNVTIFIPASFPDSIRDMINSRGAKFVDVSDPMKISDFIYSTGELYGPPNEQSLIVNSKMGVIVVTGCAHPGITNIVEKAKELTKKEVYLVVGGFHHPPISIVEKFRELGVKKVAPSHCTGNLVREAFAKEYKEDFIEFGVGKIIKVAQSPKPTPTLTPSPTPFLTLTATTPTTPTPTTLVTIPVTTPTSALAPRIPVELLTGVFIVVTVLIVLVTFYVRRT